MPLSTLPPELRLQILQYLPDFNPDRTETIGPNIRLTPPISRVSHMLRKESLPLFAKTGAFTIATDSHPHQPRVAIWLDAFDGEPLANVQSLQLSAHWRLTQPARWQGHVGFYLKLQRNRGRGDGMWRCEAGTYPIANDVRGMRAESVELLRNVTLERLDECGGLERADVEFVVKAMEIVAANPVGAFDVEQSEGGRRRRREVWGRIEAGLSALALNTEGNGAERKPGRFFTPY